MAGLVTAQLFLSLGWTDDSCAGEPDRRRIPSRRAVFASLPMRG